MGNNKDLQWQHKTVLQRLIGRVTGKEQRKRIATLALTILIIGGLLVLIPFVRKVTSAKPPLSDLNPTDFLTTNLDAEIIRQFLLQISSRPRIAGTEGDRQSALFVEQKFKEFNLITAVHEYEVFLGFPKTAKVEQIEPVYYNAILKEQVKKKD